jgi:hypothetical protein
VRKKRTYLQIGPLLFVLMPAGLVLAVVALALLLWH